MLSLTYECNLAGIAEEAALDGIYVLRTSVAQQLLSAVERAFEAIRVLI